MREILNSSQGFSASDYSTKATFSRIIKSYQVLDGICFVGLVGTQKSRLGGEENIISKVLTGDDSEYQELILNNKFVPARKAPPPSELSSPKWQR